MPDYSFAIRALKARNYRLFFGGQSISLVGTWMTRIATSWLAWRLTHSAVLLGVVTVGALATLSGLGPRAPLTRFRRVARNVSLALLFSLALFSFIILYSIESASDLLFLSIAPLVVGCGAGVLVSSALVVGLNVD